MRVAEAIQLLIVSFVAVLLLLANGCAVPVAPTGGPEDSKPPLIETMSPARDAVNVTTDRLVITFDEYVRQSSFAQAFDITPELPNPPRFNWKKRKVEVILGDSLRDNTTYIITIDSKLRDLNGVSLLRPEIIAFSTGPVINRARISGSIISSEGGSDLSGYEIHAFAMVDSSNFPATVVKPDYRTQSSSDGVFSFEYLADGIYYVAGFDDVNGNRTLDPGEASGASRRGWVRATLDSLAAPTLIAAVVDTIAPALRRASSVSATRTMLRFSEGIIRDSSAIRIVGPSGNAVHIRWIYALSENHQDIGIVSDRLEGDHLVHSIVADSSGNRDSSRTAFTAVQSADTLSLRFDSFFSGLEPDSSAATYRFFTDGSFGFTTNGVLGPAAFEQGISLAAESPTTAIDFDLRTSDGRQFFIYPLQRGFPDTLNVSIAGAPFGIPDTVYSARYVRLAAGELGELSGHVAAYDSTAPTVITLQPDEDIVIPPDQVSVTVAPPGGRFVFPELVEGRYGLRIFADVDRDGEWDAGTTFPFSPHEPILWVDDTLRVRPRWESVMADTLTFDYP